MLGYQTDASGSEGKLSHWHNQCIWNWWGLWQPKENEAADINNTSQIYVG